MDDLKISVVLPCLNEEKTIEYCINEALEGIKLTGLKGEVVVADNGSTDNSKSISESNGARVVNVKERGYGSALRGGIESAHGKYIVMGDADSTYNFKDLSLIVKELANGYDLAIGNRFAGGIEKNAMPFANKYIGNPILSFIARKLFKTHIRDFHCGLRGFTKDAYKKMNLSSSGMEFATEMIAKASLINLNITEIPTSLKVSIHPRTPHLKPIRDGLRHLKLMITYSFLKLFNLSFNILVGIFLPLYTILLFLVPFKIEKVILSFGTLFAMENILLISLILKSILNISSDLFPEFLKVEKKEKRNFGFLYFSIGIFLYFYSFLNWSVNEFGILNQTINLKLSSVTSLFMTYGIFEIFRLLIDTTSKYFKSTQ